MTCDRGLLLFLIVALGGALVLSIVQVLALRMVRRQREARDAEGASVWLGERPTVPGGSL